MEAETGRRTPSPESLWTSIIRPPSWAPLSPSTQSRHEGGGSHDTISRFHPSLAAVQRFERIAMHKSFHYYTCKRNETPPASNKRNSPDRCSEWNQVRVSLLVSDCFLFFSLSWILVRVLCGCFTCEVLFCRVRLQFARMRKRTSRISSCRDGNSERGRGCGGCAERERDWRWWRRWKEKLWAVQNQRCCESKGDKMKNWRSPPMKRWWYL